MEQLINDPKGQIIVGKWISILYRQFQIYFNQHLKAEDVSSSEYIFLMTLYREDGLSQDTLSSRLSVDKAATARAVKALEEKQYVIRKKDPHDKRINRVYITEQGIALQAKIFPVLNSWNALITDNMPIEEIKHLSDTLENITMKVLEINFNNKEKHNE